MPETGSTNRIGAAGRVEVFEYPAGPDAPRLPAWEGWAMESAAGTPGEPARDYAHRAIDAGVRTEFDQRLAGETRRSFEAGREQGRMEGGQTEREAQAAAHATAEQRRAHQAAELIDSFALERDRYLLAVEHEVVELALAVTARILRREAQMDPLLLTGAVRVALGQLSASTQVRLLVPPAELDLWTETFALLPKLRVKPTVVPGEGMRLGECAIETELGTADMGIRAQLGEIERGFFDRAGGRGAGTVAHEEPGRGMETQP
ncbi:MAG: FliH/SctL family protein [Terracidiphilus sp.]